MGQNAARRINGGYAAMVTSVLHRIFHRTEENVGPSKERWHKGSSQNEWGGETLTIAPPAGGFVLAKICRLQDGYLVRPLSFRICSAKKFSTLA